MNNQIIIKRPILKSILYTLLILIFPVFAGVAITILQSNELNTFRIQSLCFFVSIIVGLIFASKSKFSFDELGITFLNKENIKTFMFYIPIFIIEIIAISCGFRKDLTLELVLTILVFTFCVGIAEELYFRSLILSSLKQFGIGKAIIISSFLFGIGHLSNLAGGADLASTILQVIFAFLFGVVASEITFLNKSILVPAIWHFIHNFLSISTIEVSKNFDTILVCAQCAILIIYSIYLWKKIKNIKN